MNKTIKFILISMLVLSIAACSKKNTKPEEDSSADGSGTSGTEVIDTTGINDGPICCNPEDLDNPNSLLSKRVIYFDYDQSTIEPEYRELIALHARYLSENPSARMTLEGHADERGSREYNLALGERRANAVAGLMKAQGASASQINVVSYGEERPAENCSNESCWSKNRRAVVVYTAK